MPYTGPYNKILYGKDFNFYQKIAVTASGSFSTNCDIVIPFSTQQLNLSLESTGVIEYSFNGNNIHGQMDSTKNSANLQFPDRVVSKIWFRLVSGTGTVRVEAWATR
jgi:hypothetical protein